MTKEKRNVYLFEASWTRLDELGAPTGQSANSVLTTAGELLARVPPGKLYHVIGLLEDWVERFGEDENPDAQAAIRRRTVAAR